MATDKSQPHKYLHGDAKKNDHYDISLPSGPAKNYQMPKKKTVKPDSYTPKLARGK